ncbi:MAG: DegT/DnrJ/EryC1/StrS family aminotransferase [Pseudomonadota bacterium]
MESNESKIDFANLKKQYFDIQPVIEKHMDEVLNTTSFIMGDKVQQLETKLQDFTQSKHAITCSSGTDALLLAMMAMDIQPGDEIITTPFTFIATAETIVLMKAIPVFVDIEADTLNIDASKIEAAITEKTKAIMPVSLYGQPADMDRINALAKKYQLKIIIDGAQSFGATYKQKQEVHYCDIYTTSFFPAKPLGCYGDGGAVFTNNNVYAEKIKMLRVHGQNKRYHHKYIGMGGRMDTLQAAVILAKLPNYATEIQMRQNVAKTYSSKLKSADSTLNLTLLTLKKERGSVFAQYTIQTKDREKIQTKLIENSIPIAIHYPMPLHKQECFQDLNQNEINLPIAEKAAKEVMSLPMNPFITHKEIELIVACMSEK